jgi:hypothetical protein
MNRIEISNLNPAGANLFEGADSFITELQEVETTKIMGGSKKGRGGGTFFYSSGFGGGGFGGGGFGGGGFGGFGGFGGYGGYRRGFGGYGGFGGGNQILFFGGGGRRS